MGGGIVVTFLGVIVLIGWTLGIIESISITVLVGLSVDYVVHIANAYNESPKENNESRFVRTRLALIEMGISIFSASITTLFSATFLLGTVVIFFSRFGLFIFLVVIISTFFAFGYTVALLFLVGPVRNQGDFAACFKSIKNKAN